MGSDVTTVGATVYLWVDACAVPLVGDRLRLEHCGECRVTRVSGTTSLELCLVECERVSLLDRLRERLTPKWFAYGH